jgi:hypothetical protein
MVLLDGKDCLEAPEHTEHVESCLVGHAEGWDSASHWDPCDSIAVAHYGREDSSQTLFRKFKPRKGKVETWLKLMLRADGKKVAVIGTHVIQGPQATGVRRRSPVFDKRHGSRDLRSEGGLEVVETRLMEHEADLGRQFGTSVVVEGEVNAGKRLRG